MVSTRNLTIPGRIKPAQRIINALADEAAEVAKSVQAQPWQRLAMRSALAVSQSKRQGEAREALARVYDYAEKARRFPGRKLK